MLPQILCENKNNYKLKVRKFFIFMKNLVAEELARFNENPGQLGRVLLGLFRNRNTWNRRYLCSFGSYSVYGMNGISFRLFCSR